MNTAPSQVKSALAVSADSTVKAKGLLLAQQLQLPFLEIIECDYDYVLYQTIDRLELRSLKDVRTGPVYVDFLSGKMAYRRQKLSPSQETLYRAVGLHRDKHLQVIDATAGLGKDAFILASFGCEVTLVERSPILAALLEDGIARLKQNTEISLTLISGDSVEYLQKENPQVDVIYLDPMFPGKTKNALPKKEMQFLQDLLGEEDTSPRLLQEALRHAKKRVVVKRPVSGPPLANMPPSHSVKTKTCRFDVYLAQKQSITP